MQPGEAPDDIKRHEREDHVEEVEVGKGGNRDCGDEEPGLPCGYDALDSQQNEREVDHRVEEEGMADCGAEREQAEGIADGA